MFGKPEWFSEKSVGWGLRPVSWKGWGYSGVWAIIIGLPFLGLLWQHLLPEALIWVGTLIGLLLWDVRQVLRARRRDPSDDVVETAVALESTSAEPIAQSSTAPAGESEPDSDVLIIDENTEPDPAYFNTRSFDFHWRR